MKKIFLGILILLVTLLGVLAFTKDMLAKALLTKVVKDVAGLEIRVDSVRIGILKTFAGIEGLRIFNPPGMTDKSMAEVPEIYVEYDLPSFFKNKVHLKELRLNIKELVIVEGQGQDINVSKLGLVLPKPSGGKKPPELTIDLLSLKLGRVVYKDYSQKPDPKVLEFNLNIDQTFRNVTDPAKLAGQLGLKILASAGLSDFLNSGLKPVQEQASQAAKESQAAASQAVGAAKETLNTAAEEMKKIFGQ